MAESIKTQWGLAPLVVRPVGQHFEIVAGARRFRAVLDEGRLIIILRQHNLGKPNGTTDAPAKLLSEFLRKADESTLGGLLVKLAVLHAAASPHESSKVLREAAEFYKMDVGAITTKVKQEFATKDKAKAAKTASLPKPAAKGTKKPMAA